MKTIELTTATRPFSEYAGEFGEEIVVLTTHKKPIAAIVSLRKVDKESLALSTNPEFLKIIADARAEYAAGKTLSLDEMRREALA
jgi:antitoxin (DNA-binding transcriptional repressor) of toxin-antitoxin stability system